MKHIDCIKILLVIAAIGLANDAIAATYYVATTGNDNNAGTQTAPFKTIQKGATVAKAGDTVMVLPGTYIGSVKNTNHGTASARIRFVSQVKWEAKIVSNSGNISFAAHGNYVDIEGFDVTASNDAHVGIAVYGSFSRILYNHVHDYRAPVCGSNGGAGILTANYDSSDKDMIGNVVHDIGTVHLPASAPYCNSIHGIYHGTRGGKVQNNIVYRSASAGIHLWHAATEAVASHNLSFNNRGVGIIFGCGNAPFIQCDNITVSNNIFMNNKGAFAIREYGNNGSGNRVFNNIVYGNTSNTIEMKTGTASGNKIGVDPKLVNFQVNGGGNYQLTSTSPAINAGTTACAPGHSPCVPTIDIAGTARPQGSGHDIGPYEFKTTTTPPPPTPSLPITGHWRLDETSGTAAADASGKANPGAYVNTPTSVTGKYGRARSFSGNTGSISTNDRVLIGDPANGSLDFGTGSFSYGLWVNVSATAGNYDMAWSKGGGSAGNAGYDMELGAGRWTACLADGDEAHCSNFSAAPITGRWVHLMVVVDRANARMIAYVDGVVATAQVLPTTLGSVSGASPAAIGATSAGSHPFLGSIDDVRIYSRALTAAEVKQVMTTP